MAVILWTGDTSGAWPTGGNWEGGSAPGVGDTAVFSQTNDIVTGIPAANVDEIRVVEGFGGVLGTSDDPILINATTVTIDSLEASAFFAGTYTTVYVMNTGPTTPSLTLHNCDITTVDVLNASGSIAFTGGNGPSKMNIYNSPDMRITADSAGDNFTNIAMDSGTVESARSCTSKLVVHGGYLRITGDQASGTLTQYGGLVDYRTSGTLSNAKIYGGLLDLTANGQASVTITNPEITDGVIDERNGMQNVTYTNDVDILGKGSFFADRGRTLAVS